MAKPITASDLVATNADPSAVFFLELAKHYKYNANDNKSMCGFISDVESALPGDDNGTLSLQEQKLVCQQIIESGEWKEKQPVLYGHAQTMNLLLDIAISRTQPPKPKPTNSDKDTYPWWHGPGSILH